MRLSFCPMRLSTVLLLLAWTKFFMAAIHQTKKTESPTLPATNAADIFSRQYRDSQLVVINKPSGLLSVPGRTADKQDCVSSRLKKLFPKCIEQPSVHRLDMETSGLMVYALTKEAHRNLSAQFEAGTVHKKYVALIDGVFNHNEYKGVLQLKFRLDPDNRPHQIYDEENGKLGITEWEKAGTVLYTAPDGSQRRCTKIIFTPKTGRTHQLRLAASDPHGFGIPIVGDSLYGMCAPGERLMLHAFELEFTHPVSGTRMSFICKEQNNPLS